MDLMVNHSRIFSECLKVQYRGKDWISCLILDPWSLQCGSVNKARQLNSRRQYLIVNKAGPQCISSVSPGFPNRVLTTEGGPCAQEAQWQSHQSGTTAQNDRSGCGKHCTDDGTAVRALLPLPLPWWHRYTQQTWQRAQVVGETNIIDPMAILFSGWGREGGNRGMVVRASIVRAPGRQRYQEKIMTTEPRRPNSGPQTC